MLFRPRNKPPMLRRVRQFVWPSSGWNRALTYIRHRLARLPGSSYSIAAGFACGAAISFTPFVGLHFILGGLLAWAIRANIVASAIGTAVGNPWTFPFIWTWIYELGTWILGWRSAADNEFELSLSFLLAHVGKVFVPMIVGGIPTAAVAWVAFYFPMLYLVEEYKRVRRARRHNRPPVGGGPRDRQETVT